MISNKKIPESFLFERLDITWLQSKLSIIVTTSAIKNEIQIPSAPITRESKNTAGIGTKMPSVIEMRK